MSAPVEPCARGTNFISSKRAVLDLWGEEGLRLVAQNLPDDARRETLDAVVLTADQWIPERHGQAWFDAVWNGPARRLKPEFLRFIDKRIDNGFGRVRRLLLQMATPMTLAPRVPDLWRNDHTHGSLSMEHVEGNALVGALRDHPFTGTNTGRLAVAEICRYSISLTRVKDVAESHRVDEHGALLIRLSWR